MIKYSTIMPVYNAEKRLKTSIESIINQSFENWELILVDDGSKDSSLKICEEYSKKDKRIKVYHQENSGPGSARNKGIELATGEYITFIDADDYYDNKYYETLEMENEGNKYDIIYFGLVKENIDGNSNNYNNITKFKKYTKDELIKLQLMGILSWGPCLKMIRTAIAKECKFLEIPVGEEILFSFEALKRAKEIKFIENVLYHYVYNDNGQHTKGRYDPWNKVVFELKKHLQTSKELEYYEKAVNGLALRALSISIYRYSRNYRYKEAKEKIKKSISYYKEKYDLEKIEFDLLDRKNKLINFLVKHNQYLLLFIASKIKNQK